MKTSHRAARNLRTEPSSATSRSTKARVAALDLASRFPFDEPGRKTPSCANEPPGLFSPQNYLDLAEAQSICRRCPLVDRCLEVGLARGEYGVWGGVLLEAGQPSAKIHADRGPNRE